MMNAHLLGLLPLPADKSHDGECDNSDGSDGDADNGERTEAAFRIVGRVVGNIGIVLGASGGQA